MMDETEYRLCIRIAGNTGNPCLLALRAKGYALKLSFEQREDGDYRTDYDAEKEGRLFSATTPQELLGLVAMWEMRGDKWKTKQEEPLVFDELYPSSITYDCLGNILEIGDEEVENENP